MYILKGFVSYPSLVNNDPGIVAPIGELSKDSLTYSIETGQYKSADYPDAQLYVFESYELGAAPIEIPVEHKQLALDVATYVFEHSLTTDFGPDETVVLGFIEAYLVNKAIDVQIGEMVTDITGRYAPSWISYKMVGSENYVKLWFADQAFSTQYDGYSYRFVAPIVNLDDFFGGRQVVVDNLAENTISKLMQRVVEIRELDPYTSLHSMEFEWIDPTVGETPIKTTWSALVYGRAGAENEKVRSALIDWILSNSSYTREQWLEIFPDIFQPEEFVITPLWHQYAIPNQTIQAGFHTPLVTLETARNIVELTALGGGYSATEIIRNTVFMPSPTRTMTYLVTGSGINRSGISDIKQIFPDYLPLPVSSIDFARMSVKTQNFVQFLIELLMVAESVTEYSTMPFGYSRIYREGVMYVVRDFENVQYLAVSQVSLINMLGIEAPYVPEFVDNTTTTTVGA